MLPIDGGIVGGILHPNQLLGGLPVLDKELIIKQVRRKLYMNRFYRSGSLMFQLARACFSTHAMWLRCEPRHEFLGLK